MVKYLYPFFVSKTEGFKSPQFVSSGYIKDLHKEICAVVIVIQIKFRFSCHTTKIF